MKKLIIAALLIAGMMSTASALSDKKLNLERKDNLDRQDNYVGLYGNIIETTGRGSDHDVLGWTAGEYTAAGATFVYGYKVYQNEEVHLFTELRLAKTFTMEESENVHTSAYSFLLRPTYRLAKKVHVFGLFGYTYGKLDSFDDIHKYNESGSGFAVGLGGELDFNNNFSLIADGLWSGVDIYSPLLDDNVNISQFNLGLNYRF